MEKCKNIILWIGLFTVVFVSGVTFLNGFQIHLAKSLEPLEYFREVSFKTLYSLTSRGEVIDTLSQQISELNLTADYSKLDGTVLSSPEKMAIAMMIDNHPQARPQQSGLSKASIVYEALAEGDITRFLAVFSYQNLAKVGPVRSARPYFLRWAQEYKGGYGHAGGSPDALALIPETGLINLEGLYYEEIDGKTYFFRDNNYYAPHNLFANLLDLNRLILEKKPDITLPDSHFKFGDIGDMALLDSADKITINFSDSSFRVNYDYDETRDVYLRSLAGKPHIDKLDGSQIAPRNVLVQFTSYFAYDEKGRLKMRVDGEGKGLLFLKGKVSLVTWKKEDSDFTEFYDEKGNEISLSPGQIWIEILEEEERVSWEMINEQITNN